MCTRVQVVRKCGSMKNIMIFNVQIIFIKYFTRYCDI